MYEHADGSDASESQFAAQPNQVHASVHVDVEPEEIDIV